jgi:hypothetical protein
MHKRVKNLERNLHSRTQELNAVKAEFAEFKTSVEKQLADIHSVVTGRVPADAPGQHSCLACDHGTCRLPAYVDGLRSGPSYVFARLESIINPSSCPDYSNYAVQNPAASGWSELSHNEHARQTAQETKKRLSRMMPDYIQRKDALTIQQKERSAQMQMRMEKEKEERREASRKKKQLADIHSVMSGCVPADAPGQHSGLEHDLRMCRLPAYVDGSRSGSSYVLAQLESIINPSSRPDYSNYGVQNPAASGWSELSHNEHARQTAPETKTRSSCTMPDYIQRKDALINQQKETFAQTQMRMGEEKEERREAFWKKRADEQLREAIHAGKC